VRLVDVQEQVLEPSLDHSLVGVLAGHTQLGRLMDEDSGVQPRALFRRSSSLRLPFEGAIHAASIHQHHNSTIMGLCRHDDLDDSTLSHLRPSELVPLPSYVGSACNAGLDPLLVISTQSVLDVTRVCVCFAAMS